MMMFIWLAVGLGIFYFIENNKIASMKYEYVKTPETILYKRYMNGEIDDVTYKKMK